jgi:GH15 family glucan-1,4-alpha-glucosidase
MPEAEKQVLDEEDNFEVEVAEEEEQDSGGEQPEEPRASGDSDELADYSEGVKKRISKLTAKMREAERREQAALQYAQSVQKQLEESSRRTSSLDQSFVQEFENRVTLQDQLLRRELKDAIDRGDIDRQVEAQKQLAQIASHSERLQYVKQQQALAAQQRQMAPQQVPQPQAQPQQQRRPDPKAEQWAERNEWFGSDEAMTITAFAIHKNLVENEGYDPNGDDYYQELDRRIRGEFPHKFGQKGGNTNGRSGPAVAGAQRGGTRGGKQSIKLSPSQVAIARKLGITNEQYAKQLLRMQQNS